MIEVAEINRLHNRVQTAGFTIVIPLEERWYRQNEVEYGRKQFVVADPDGYLLRFSTSLGQRSARQ
jgi:catechol 2,3-dioxygenase-like lactoylglutathione lyase family enzyme